MAENKNFRNCPETLEKLQEIRYNNKEIWEQLKRERNTVNDINKKAWTEAFKGKSIDTYYDLPLFIIRKKQKLCQLLKDREERKSGKNYEAF